MVSKMFAWAFVLLVTQVSYGQQTQVVSYYAEGAPGTTSLVLVPQVSANGLVITDVLVRYPGKNSEPLTFVEVRDQSQQPRFKLYFPEDGAGTWHFSSGFAFASGSTVEVSWPTAQGLPTHVSVTGYLPSPDDREVVSYAVEIPAGETSATLIDNVPPDGFILTDLATSCCDTVFRQIIGEREEIILLHPIITAYDLIVSLTNGFPIAGGSTLTVTIQNKGGIGQLFAVSGYIPRLRSAPAPALGSWGIAVMALLVLAAGTVVFRRVAPMYENHR